MPLRTKPSSLYRHRRDLGLYRVGLRRKESSHPNAKLAIHAKESPIRNEGRPSISYLHDRSVRPMSHSPTIRGPLNPGLPHSKSHELTKRALESNDDLGTHGLSFPPLPSRKDFAHFFYMALTWQWVVLHYISFAHIATFTLHDMPFLCLCHAFVTHALHYT